MSIEGPRLISVESATRRRDPAEIAQRVISAIRENDLYIFTHPEWSWEVENRFAAIQKAMDKVAAMKA